MGGFEDDFGMKKSEWGGTTKGLLAILEVKNRVKYPPSLRGKIWVCNVECIGTVSTV